MGLLAKLSLSSEGLVIEGDPLAMPKGSGWFVPTLDPATFETAFRSKVKEGRWKFTPGVLDGAYGVMVTARGKPRTLPQSSSQSDPSAPADG
jgi:hypothetical protein